MLFLKTDAPELQSHGIYSTAIIAHIWSKTCSWRAVDFEYRNVVYQSIKSTLSFTVVSLREISSIAAPMKLLLPIEIHVAVYEFRRRTHPQSQVYSFLQNCAIQVSLLRGLGNNGAAPPAGVHSGAVICFGKQYLK